MPEKPDVSTKPPAAARSLTLKFHFENAPLCPECAAPLAWSPWTVLHGVALCIGHGYSDHADPSLVIRLMRHRFACNHVRGHHGILFWTPHTTSGRPITIIEAEQFLTDRKATQHCDPLPYDLTGYETPRSPSDESNVSQD